MYLQRLYEFSVPAGQLKGMVVVVVDVMVVVEVYEVLVFMLVVVAFRVVVVSTLR